MGRIMLWVGGIIAVLIAAALCVVFLVFPNVSAAPDMKVELTPERVARGDYLFNVELACTACHTPGLEPHRFSRVPDNTRIGAGRYFGGPPDFPAEINTPNLTPTALGDWTDGEIYRAIVSGVARDGRALFPLMPYPFYRTLDPEDVKALVAYMRTLPPQPVTLDPVSLPMPLPVFMRFVPADPAPQTRPDPWDEIALGKYLATVSSCFECHTRRNDKGVPTGIPFAGGNPFPLPGGGLAYSANITPDDETGIGTWSREDFIAMFRSRTREIALNMEPGPQDFDTEMPWTSYAEMNDRDLGAIYAYLRTVEPVKAEIVKFSPREEKAGEAP